MRLKSIVKYYLHDVKLAIFIFYGIIITVWMFISSLIVYSGTADNNKIKISGSESASFVFLFVFGIIFFRQIYLYLSTNGITRKAQFYGFLIGSVLIAALMALVDTTFDNLLVGFIDYRRTLFSQSYGVFIAAYSKPIIILVNFLWKLAINLFAIIVGYFISLLYYRMSKALKIVVSIGVPAVFWMLLPALDFKLFDGIILKWAGNLFITLIGTKNADMPLAGITVFLTMSVLLSGLAYFLVRRAPIKD